MSRVDMSIVDITFVPACTGGGHALRWHAGSHEDVASRCRIKMWDQDRVAVVRITKCACMHEEIRGCVHVCMRRYKGASASHAIPPESRHSTGVTPFHLTPLSCMLCDTNLCAWVTGASNQWC